jgi:deoxyribose-phosphate aldolase
VTEIAVAVRDGADEVDIVANIAAIKANDWETIQRESDAVVAETRQHANVILKVIIESGVLTDDEIIHCCKIYGAAKIDYLKTSTGFAEKGATVHAVQLFRSNLPEGVQIKASGGIRTLSEARAMVAAGATRLGCSAGVNIVNEERQNLASAEAVSDSAY